MLEVRSLACLRGDRLLFSRLELVVSPGELVRVRGPNGLGKTTLLRMLCGLTHPEDGVVSWQGEDIQRQREPFHRALLYVGHAPALNDLLTPLENLRFAVRSGGDVADDAQLEDALLRIGLGAQLDLPCRVLSQGQRRRVGLARLFLAAGRPLWLLDEPFNALDVGAVADLAATLDAHCGRGGSVLLITHQDVAFQTPVRDFNLGDFAC